MVGTPMSRTGTVEEGALRNYQFKLRELAHIKTIDELIPPMEVWEGQALGNVAGALGLYDGVRRRGGGSVSTPVPTPPVPPEVKAFPQAPTVLPVEGRAASTGRCWVCSAI